MEIFSVFSVGPLLSISHMMSIANNSTNIFACFSHLLKCACMQGKVDILVNMVKKEWHWKCVHTHDLARKVQTCLPRNEF